MDNILSPESEMQTFMNKIAIHDKCMLLSIFIDSNDDALKKMYKIAAENHNNKIMDEPHFYDSGFDLFLPRNDNKSLDGETTFFCKNTSIKVNKVDFKVKCCSKMFTKSQSLYSPFYTYARSSMSKTPLRIANNQGIIDAGYRGNILGMFDCIYGDSSNSDSSNSDSSVWTMGKYSRMVQICAPGLVPIYVKIVDNMEELGPSTSRGEGGFGSTGK